MIDMSDVLDEAQALVQCKACPWYKNCVLPMRVTGEDLAKQLEASMPGAAQYSMPEFLSSLAAAAQNSLLEGCPIFIGRLRSNPKLAERIKKMMQEWAKEGEEATH
jgi:NAD dependent epimerase/dehydratase family enzyme